MTTVQEPTTTPRLADRMKAADVDDRWRELPDEIQHAALTEETIEKACAWLEAHPRVPAWLNLDAVCPPELRAQIPDLIAEVDALKPIVDDLTYRCWLVLHHFAANLSGLDDGFEVTDDYTGRALLADPLLELGECFIVAAGEHARFSTPSWAKEVRS